MIHDTDLIDALVTQIQAASWTDAVADVRRVWGGDVQRSEIPVGRVICQLWPESQSHTRINKGAPWSLTVGVGVMFATQLAQQSMSEVDVAMHSFDELLSQTDGLGQSQFDLVEVSALRGGLTERATFVRHPEITWLLRPNLEGLQRMQPDGSQEQYTGLLHCQATMTYTRH